MITEIIHTAQNIIFRCNKEYLQHMIQVIAAMHLVVTNIEHDVEDNAVDYSRGESAWKRRSEISYKFGDEE